MASGHTVRMSIWYGTHVADESELRLCGDLAGKRAITADTELRLCRFFGLSDGWWLRLQADYDTEVAKAGLAKAIAKIRPWKETAERTVDAH